MGGTEWILFLSRTMGFRRQAAVVNVLEQSRPVPLEAQAGEQKTRTARNESSVKASVAAEQGCSTPGAAIASIAMPGQGDSQAYAHQVHHQHQGEWRGPRYPGRARRQSTGAAGGQQILLLAAREQPGNQPGRLLVGTPHADERAARFVAAKLYRYFVRDCLDPALAGELGERLQALDFEIAPFLEMLFSSRDFHAPASVATRIKSPVELIVSTYRKLGMSHLRRDYGGLGRRLIDGGLSHPLGDAGFSRRRRLQGDFETLPIFG